MLYVLLDTNVAAGYYLPRSLNSEKAKIRSQQILDYARVNPEAMFLYLPNFCVAETFSVFMKHSFGKWNSHVSKKGTIDTRVYNSLVKQFAGDIHNGTFIYHYELSRYHVLAINLVAPIDHYFKFKRKRKNVAPMGTFDHLIIAMGIHLTHIHGKDNVVVLTTDDRISDILDRCHSDIPVATQKKLKLDKVEDLTGKKFQPETFPRCLNLKSVSDKRLREVFGEWPLNAKTPKGVYRYVKK